MNKTLGSAIYFDTHLKLKKISIWAVLYALIHEFVCPSSPDG